MTTRGLRFVLIAGFGGMLLIFLLAAIDAIHLLNGMRAESQALRDASVERSRRLETIRTYILLCDRNPDPTAQLRAALSQALENLAGYRTSRSEETAELSELRQLLERHWRGMELAEPPAPSTILEINTRVQAVDTRQLAEAQNEIRGQFESLGRKLALVLTIALCFALLLAAGSVLYISRIEREDRRRYQELREGRAQLEQLSARLVDAQETERRSISRELHDEVGQTLGAVLVDAANLANRIPADDTVSHRYLDDIRAQADSSVNAIRNIALLLRPSMLDDLGLVPALEWQAREVSRRSGVKVRVTAENVSDALPDALRTCVYRVVQEALRNIERHSKASNAVVDVRQSNDALSVKVEDDGGGFEPAKTRGMGLLGMEERVKQLGGRIELRSQPGKGTTLQVSLPLMNYALANGVKN